MRRKGFGYKAVDTSLASGRRRAEAEIPEQGGAGKSTTQHSPASALLRAGSLPANPEEASGQGSPQRQPRGAQTGQEGALKRGLEPGRQGEDTWHPLPASAQFEFR